MLLTSERMTDCNYTLRFSWLQLLSSPSSVCQGWLLLPGGVQPPSGGHESLQCTVVLYHPTVNVCQCIVGKDKRIASCQMLVNICSTWRMSQTLIHRYCAIWLVKHTMKLLTSISHTAKKSGATLRGGSINYTVVTASGTTHCTV